MSACKLHGEYACGKCMIVRNSLPERRFDTSPIYYEQKIGELHDRIAALERDLAAAQARIERYEALLNRCSDACKVVPVLVRNGEHISLPTHIKKAIGKDRHEG